MPFAASLRVDDRRRNQRIAKLHVAGFFPPFANSLRRKHHSIAAARKTYASGRRNQSQSPA